MFYHSCDWIRIDDGYDDDDGGGGGGGGGGDGEVDDDYAFSLSRFLSARIKCNGIINPYIGNLITTANLYYILIS